MTHTNNISNAMLKKHFELVEMEDRPIEVFCDFDGTITTGDVTDLLLEHLAEPAWQEIEQRWLDGKIDDCECMAQQIALIRGAWKNIAEVIDGGITIDPHFKSFISLCNQQDIPVHIGSSGLDMVIKYILDREGIKVNGFWAYKLIEANNSWSLEFPQTGHRERCRTPNSAACKCTLLDNKLTHFQPYRIVIGDSKSDFCWSNKADFVFAKAKLAQYCAEENIMHQPFVDFSQINDQLEQSLVKEAIAA
jgi:2-hydroxy-3-keto-5-methylthiopentenyl-1-phosphate phosphatase